ncbi:asparagine synthase-related protein [Zobellia laminariae]|uniref:asparagine synthase-related protein n=1 Tax=Zobellia laminariae TaxID=248906 RepID=UPI0026F438B3|nr:asparagine synthase-related protein [Zobellia laminariae]WKX75034.1 asparagine synthase-related protein [Zobellia laminariae]
MSIDHNPNFNFAKIQSEQNNDLSYKIQLKNAVEKTIKGLKIDTSKWTLALSGGMDSRSLLFHLQNENLNSVTCGLSEALELPTSDASIAKNLAQICKMKHSYAKMDFKQNSFPILLERF